MKQHPFNNQTISTQQQYNIHSTIEHYPCNKRSIFNKKLTIMQYPLTVEKHPLNDAKIEQCVQQLNNIRSIQQKYTFNAKKQMQLSQNKCSTVKHFLLNNPTRSRQQFKNTRSTAQQHTFNNLITFVQQC